MSRDSQRAIAAAKVILDGRDPATDGASILVTLDHLVATVLLVTQGLDHRKAVGMLNEGLVPHVEDRIALHAAKRGGR
jgi:hypothetical protein